MKKLLNLIMLVAVVVISGTMLTACGGNNITGVYLTYSQDNISLEQKSSDIDNKNYQYEINTEYGTQINLNNFNFFCTKEKDGNVQVSKKTDSTSGYLVDGDLGNQNVGTYTLTFSYEGWTATVTVNISKQVVTLPTLDGETSYTEVDYNGKDYTTKMQYDHSVLRMLNPTEKRIEPKQEAYPNNYYNIEFELIDKINYKWPEGVAIDVNSAGNYVFNFIINKAYLEVDLSDYLTEIGQTGVNQATFSFSKANYSGDIFNDLKTSDALNSIKINGKPFSDFSNKIKVIVSNDNLNANNVTTTNPQIGNYYLMLAVNDGDHYVIKTATNTESAREFAIIGTISITE